MPGKVLTLALGFGLQWFTGVALPAQTAVETRSVPARRGDTLVINNDRGSIRIRSAPSATVEVKIRRRMPSLKVVLQRNADTISLRSLFSGLPGEAVDFDIRAPGFIHVKISGMSPDIDIGEIQGNVNIEDRTGMVLAENLTSAVSLITEKGDVVYRANLQPQGDVRIESNSGNLYFELAEHLNLRGRFHAGGTITWNRKPASAAQSLEKQLGTLGPLLYAGSLKGNVEVRFMEIPQVIGAVTAPPSRAQPDVHGRNSQKAQETVKPAEAVPVIAQEAARGTGATGGAQQPATPYGGYSLKINVDAVLLNVSVLDRNSGRSISQLQREDFLVYEDGVLQQVEQLAQTDAPFNLLLLLDVSGSTQSFLPMMKQAAIDFTRQIKPNDRIAVATFNSSVSLIQNFTNDRDDAARAIQMIQSGGGTAFYDALMACINQYMRDVEGRSAIVVFSDGVDNQLYGEPINGSFIRFDELYRRIQEIEPVIYTIFLDTEGMVPTASGGPGRADTGAIIDILGDIIRGGRTPGSYPPGNPNPLPNPNPRPRGYPSSPAERAAYAEAIQQLLLIAEQTGGRFYSPRRIEELSRVYSQIADDLRIQYQLSYNSTNHKNDGRWREIRVQIKNHPRAVVRTRKGYFARKQEAPIEYLPVLAGAGPGEVIESLEDVII